MLAVNSPLQSGMFWGVILPKLMKRNECDSLVSALHAGASRLQVCPRFLFLDRIYQVTLDFITLLHAEGMLSLCKCLVWICHLLREKQGGYLENKTGVCRAKTMRKRRDCKDFNLCVPLSLPKLRENEAHACSFFLLTSLLWVLTRGKKAAGKNHILFSARATSDNPEELRVSAQYASATIPLNMQAAWRKRNTVWF